MNKVLLVSFDAVSSGDFDRLAALPNFRRFVQEAYVARNVPSIFLTNTYPIHTSVVTGVTPEFHGVISNTRFKPEADYQEWVYRSRSIRAKPLWRAAKQAGLTTAAVLWPVTGGASEINWNVPEIMIKPGRAWLLRQVAVGLLRGSFWTQIKAIARHGRMLSGTDQPRLDNFATAVMLDIIEEHQPDLSLIHLTAFDTLCHKYGRDFDKLTPALESLDRNLGALVSAMPKDALIIVFSDHGQLDVYKTINPNFVLRELGFVTLRENEAATGSYKYFIENCGGSAFVHSFAKPGTPEEISVIKSALEKSEGFGRFLTPAEMRMCGRGRLPLGFAAAPGFSYDTSRKGERANHGYPIDYDAYKVFYAVRQGGAPLKPAGEPSLLNLAGIIGRELGLTSYKG